MHVCALVTQRTSASLFTHMHTLGSMWRIIMDIYAQAHTPVHAPKTLASTLIHTCLDTSPSIPQLSAPITYLQFHDSPHVSLYFQTTKKLRRSSLDLSALPFFNWNTAASLFASLSVSQPGSQSIHKLLTPATDAHSQKRGKKRNTQGGISNGEKQKQRNSGEQSVILGSVCVAEWLVWS